MIYLEKIITILVLISGICLLIFLLIVFFEQLIKSYRKHLNTKNHLIEVLAKKQLGLDLESSAHWFSEYPNEEQLLRILAKNIYKYNYFCIKSTRNQYREYLKAKEQE